MAVTSRALYKIESAGDKLSDPTIKHPKSFPTFNKCSSSKLNAKNPTTLNLFYQNNLISLTSNSVINESDDFFNIFFSIGKNPTIYIRFLEKHETYKGSWNYGLWILLKRGCICCRKYRYDQRPGPVRWILLRTGSRKIGYQKLI